MEFALVVLPFMLLVLGSIDFGIAMNRDTLVNNSAREGAREGSLNPTVADIDARVRSSLVNVPPSAVTVSVTCRKPSGAACGNFAADAVPGGTVIVRVVCTYDWLTPIGGIINSSGLTLTKTAEMRIE